MRKLFTLLGIVLLTGAVCAQTPEKMSYQALVRGASNNLVTNHSVGMRVSILQGSTIGTESYTEIYNPNPLTNANGLVTIEIGSGIPLIGEFAAIDWANGPYFIKTETDPTGGTDYTITGTSQLLSVPYALYAKMAENGITAEQTAIVESTSGINTGDQNISGIATNSTAITTLQTEQSTQNTAIIANTAKISYPAADATKLADIEMGAEVNVQADWNQISNKADDFIKNKPIIPITADGSETKVTSGTNITITGSGTTASPYVVNVTGATNLVIGQNYQGGIIFWLDATGQHGLIAATSDQSLGVQWSNGNPIRRTGSTGSGIYAGAMNTAMIVATQMADDIDGEFAAKVCSDSYLWVGNLYGDWYLPSVSELKLLYNQKTAVGGFVSEYYWSSTEHSDFIQNAYSINFGSGLVFDYTKSHAYRVRPVRQF